MATTTEIRLRLKAERKRLLDEAFQIAAGVPGAPDPTPEHIQAALSMVGVALQVGERMAI